MRRRGAASSSSPSTLSASVATRPDDSCARRSSSARGRALSESCRSISTPAPRTCRGSSARRRAMKTRGFCTRLVYHAVQAHCCRMLTIRSPAFAQGATIPSLHTCQGKDLSPALEFSGAPKGTKSLALIVDDPDAPDPKAPKTTWVHWVLYNLPPDCRGLPQGVTESALPEGTLPGLNDWKRTGYGGPCPPIGRHRYFFKLFALDILLDDLGTPTRQRLERAFAGHVLEKAELMGTYEKA